MNQSISELLEQIKDRVLKAKPDAFIFGVEETPVLVHGKRSFKVIEYGITLRDHTGMIYNTICLSPIKVGTEHPYTLIFDNHDTNNSGESKLRFILYKEQNAVLSSNDEVEGSVYICVINQDGRNPMVINFSIATGPKGRYSAFVSDCDTNYLQYARTNALLISAQAGRITAIKDRSPF